MAELEKDYPTINDLVREKHPDGTFMQAAPVLTQKNPLLGILPWRPANQGSSHLSTVDGALPAAALRAFNEVVQATKGASVQVVDRLAMIENWSEVDADLLEVEGGDDPAAYRANEARRHIAAISHEWAENFFYGNAAANPKEFTGLSIRYSDPTAANGRNVIDMGGTGGDNASIWFLNVKHPDGISLIHPKSSKSMGIARRDFGKVAAETHGSQTGNIEKFKEKFSLKVGMTSKDWRLNARVASIDISNLRDRTNDADLFEGMTYAYHALEELDGVVLACNRTIAAWLDLQAQERVQGSGGLTYETVDGRPMLHYRGMPIYVTDALTNSEAAV